MRYVIIISVVTVLVVSYLVFKKSKTNQSSVKPIMDEWEAKVSSAELNEELFNKSTDEEKIDLLLYFINKIQREDNYGDKSFKNMPQSIKVVTLVDELEREVNNGGFLQFFTNSSGRYVIETIEVLELINASYTKVLLEDALDIMRKYNESFTTLNGRLNSIELHEVFTSSELYDNDELLDELGELDSKFYEYNDDLTKLYLQYFEKLSEWRLIDEKYN